MGRPAEPQRGSRLAADPWLWLAIAIGGALRLIRLGAPSLWLDEAISAQVAALAAPEIVAAAAKDFHPPGYYLVLHLWVLPWPAPASEWALRSLSACASILTLPLVYGLGLRWASVGGDPRSTARWAVTLAALSPYAIGLGREARPYALLALLLAAQWTLWTRLRRRGGGWFAWGGMALLLAAGGYLHYMMLPFWLALTAATFLDERPARGFGGRWTAASLVAALAQVPWLPALRQQMAAGAQDWLPFHHSPLSMVRTAAGFIRGTAAHSNELGMWAVPLTYLFVLGTMRGGRVPAVLLVGPLVIAYAASYAVNVFDPRYLAGAALAAWVLAARGIRSVPSGQLARRGVHAAALLCVAASLWGTVGLHAGREGKKENWRELATMLKAESSPNAVTVVPFSEPFAPLRYYTAGANLRLVAGLSATEEGSLVLSSELAAAVSGAPEAFYVSYLEDLYDPQGEVRAALFRAGFRDTGIAYRSGKLGLWRFRRQETGPDHSQGGA